VSSGERLTALGFISISAMDDLTSLVFLDTSPKFSLPLNGFDFFFLS